MNFKKCSFILILLLFFAFSSASSFASFASCDLKSSVFRLHVIANSDSDEDQSLKLRVRDAILSYINEKNLTSKAETIDYCYSNLSELKDIALDVIRESGFDYDVNVEIGTFSFPTKKYGDISLPSGFYDALEVKIGNSAGHNWWCVLFPPLCFVDVSSGVVPDSSKALLEDSLYSDDFNLISSDLSDCSDSYTFKFKVVEIINDIYSRFSSEN